MHPKELLEITIGVREHIPGGQFFPPDGKQTASAPRDDENIRVYDTSSMALSFTLTGHTK